MIIPFPPLIRILFIFNFFTKSFIQWQWICLFFAIFLLISSSLHKEGSPFLQILFQEFFLYHFLAWNFICYCCGFIKICLSKIHGLMYPILIPLNFKHYTGTFSQRCHYSHFIYLYCPWVRIKSRLVDLLMSSSTLWKLSARQDRNLLEESGLSEFLSQQVSK